jgi:hypothetical protein
MVLPVKQEDIYMGFAEINGLIRADANNLEIEYKVKDDVFGMFDSSIKSCLIPYRYIDSIEVEEKWLSGRFHIYLNRFPDLDTAFKLNENCLTFKFKKKELNKARSFKSQVLLEISELKLRDMDQDMNSLKEDKKNKTATDANLRFKNEDSGFNKKEEKTDSVLKNMLRDK